MDINLNPATIKLLAQLSTVGSAQASAEPAPFAKALLEAERATHSPTDVAETQLQDEAKLMEACRQLEAVFLNMMLAQMRQTVPDDGFISAGRGEELFTSMLDETLATEAAESGSTQLAELLYLQLRGSTEVNPSKEKK